ncbi:TolC family protein [Sphingobacterium sp.]|uniref:TolC family protein n=1 Tax=Sphingobacterium sp. TaxID=341027 RepID=UPI0028A1F956|nr:TolC family protein [Sphingobacterium sp.]
MRKHLIILIIFLLPIIGMAQEKWNLKSCIDYGLENHRSRKIRSNEQLAADAKAKEALSAYLPNISIDGSVDDNLKVQEQVIPAGLFGPNDTRVAFTKKFGTTATIQLDQTIYDQSLLTGLKANKYNAKIADYNVQASDEEIIFNVSTAYYQILVYEQQLVLLQNNLNSYKKQLAVATMQVDKGVATKVDLNKIQVSYNNTASDIQVAESDLIQSKNKLKNVMGMPLSMNLIINDSKSDSSLNDIMILDSIAFDVNQRTEYKVSEANQSLLEIDKKRIQDNIIPKISFYGRYGGNGFGDKIGESFSTINSFSAIGLKLKWNIFDGFKQGAQSRQAEYKRLNGLETLKLDADKYKLEFENAKAKLLKAQTRSFNDNKNVKLAIAVFNGIDLQYSKGVIPITDWLTAQNDLRQAQNNYLNSINDFYLARIELEKANGSLKKYYNQL